MVICLTSSVYVDGQALSIDIESELTQYEWRKLSVTESQLRACSPFRDDNRPSFWVRLTGEYAGWYYDASWEDERHKSGNFIDLLSFLRNESYQETLEYVKSEYGYEDMDEIPLRTPNKPILDVSSTSWHKHLQIENNALDDVYLRSRGIHENIVKLHEVFDNGDSIGIIWRGLDGQIKAIKYRHKERKDFWYEKGGASLSELVWGIDVVLSRGIKTVVICEAEIDAMTWQSIGRYAVAIGGARFNEKQRDLIVQSGVDEVIVAGDNDKSGRKFNEQVTKLLSGYVDLWTVDYRDFGDSKDVNELGTEKLKKVTITKPLRKINI